MPVNFWRADFIKICNLKHICGIISYEIKRRFVMIDVYNNKLNMNDDVFEELRLYDFDNPINQLVADKLKNVFDKMFKDTGVSANDFEFMCFNNKNPGAFFINSVTGNLAKNVIAVSDSLIFALNNEDELAAVIAHECGHFIWQKRSLGENTSFQERWADVNSVDLMVDAGYNPRYILEMQKKVMNDFSNKNIRLDVHGTPFARAEDVKARITTKALEIGDFDEINKNENQEWKNFQKKADDILQHNDFSTFIDKVLIKNFKTKELSKIKRLDLLKVVLGIINKGLITEENRMRVVDLSNKIRDLKFENKTDEEALLLQEIFIKLYQDYKLNIDNMRIILENSYLPAFGPFAEQFDNIKNFINSANDEKQAEMWAEKILMMDWTFYFIRVLRTEFPKFTADGADNIGKPLAYKQLEKYNNNKINRVRDLISTYYYSMDYNNYDYYTEDGIVVAYGEEAHKRYENDVEFKHKERDKGILENNKSAVETYISKLDKLADFATGKISAEDYYNFLKAISPVNYVYLRYDVVPFFNLSKFSYDDNLSEMQALYKKLLESRGYRYFNLGKDDFDENYYVFAPKEASINTIVDSMNRIADYTRNHIYYNRLKDAVYELTKYFITLDDVVGVRHIYDFLAGRDIYYSEEVRKYVEYHRKKIENLISKTPLVFQQGYGIPYNVVLNFEYSEESQFMKNIIEQFGFNGVIKTENELISILKKISLINGSEIDINQVKIFIWADFLRHGGYADLIKVLENISGHIHRPANVINEILAKYIKDEQFNSLNLYEKISFYEFMEHNRLFSDDAANQNRYIRTIVNQITALPITDKDAVGYAEKMLADIPITKYGERRGGDIKFFNEREKLIEFYSDYWANKLGPDDGSDEYLKKIQDFSKYISSSIDGYNNFSQGIKKSVVNRVSNKVLSQKKAAEILGHISDVDITAAEKYDNYFRGGEATFNILARKPKAVEKFINFLSNKLTNKSVKDLISDLSALLKLNLPESFSKSNLIMIHENFWGVDLPVRAYFMNKLLNAYSDKEQDKLDFILNMYFDKKSKYYNDAKLVINTVYKNLQDYEKNLILAALAAAGQRGINDNISGGQAVGRGLKMFLQNKGPAFIKFGQLLSYLPALDSDIRSELAQLRDKANIPNRDELFEIIKTSLPESELTKIQYVGKILGAGSFFITVQVKYNGYDAVLALMRPYAFNLTESGVDMIARTVDDLVAADKKYAPLKNILNQARTSAFSELDIEQDYKKYMQAKKNYEKFKVNYDGVDYSPDVAQWFAYGAAPDKQNAYKIMEMADGNSLMYSGWTEQEKHNLAVAYVTLELALLLSGEKWDTDRHQGQQNFYNTGFRDFCIGIFDTGAQMVKGPNNVDKFMLGNLLYELVSGAGQGKNIGDVLVKAIRNIDIVNVDTDYIDGVQRGLTALSDIIEYQKEEKDDDGNVVVSAKRLTENDLKDIVMAIYKSGIIDKVVKNTVVSRVVLDKLILWRAGLKLKGGIRSGGTNADMLYNHKLNLQYQDKDNNVDTAMKINKAQAEIEKILQEKHKKNPLGLKDAKNQSNISGI